MFLKFLKTHNGRRTFTPAIKIILLYMNFKKTNKIQVTHCKKISRNGSLNFCTIEEVANADNARFSSRQPPCWIPLYTIVE